MLGSALFWVTLTFAAVPLVLVGLVIVVALVAGWWAAGSAASAPQSVL